MTGAFGSSPRSCSLSDERSRGAADRESRVSGERPDVPFVFACADDGGDQGIDLRRLRVDPVRLLLALPIYLLIVQFTDRGIQWSISELVRRDIVDDRESYDAILRTVRRLLNSKMPC